MLNGRASFGVAAVSVLVLAAGSMAFQPGATPKDPPTRQPGQRPQRGPGGGEGGGPGQERRGPGEGGQQRGGNVEGAMKQMNRAMKQLSEQIADASKLQDNLRLINDMQRGCAMAKGLGVPKDILEKAKDDAEKAKLASEFRKDLIGAMRSFLEVEESLASGDTAGAKAKLDAIGEKIEKAHKEMGVKEEK